MSSDLSSWPREYFEPGGGDPFLFFVVYGEIDPEAAMSRSTYRSEGLPEGLDVMTYNSEVHPEVVETFREGYLWEELQNSDPELAKEIGSQTHCMVLQGDFEDTDSLNYLRDTVGLITHFLDNGGVCVYDPLSFRWWSPEQWRSDIFEPASAVPRNHIITLVSQEEEGTEWFHTRGLRKFGRPDISFPNVTTDLREGVIELCNRFIEMQAFGAVIPEGKDVNIQSLPKGLRCFHRGHMDDPDFNNVHIVIE